MGTLHRTLPFETYCCLALHASGSFDFIGDDFHSGGEGFVVLRVVHADTFVISYTSMETRGVRKYSHLPAASAFKIAQAARL